MFGLAILLLLLTIALAGFLLHEVTRTQQDLTVVANFDMPLTQSLAPLDEFRLRRRLAFKRWFGALTLSKGMVFGNSERTRHCLGICERQALAQKPPTADPPITLGIDLSARS